MIVLIITNVLLFYILVYAACEQVVTRSFPVSALFKEKKITVGGLANSLHLEQFMQEGLQLRSVTFQVSCKQQQLVNNNNNSL